MDPKMVELITQNLAEAPVALVTLLLYLKVHALQKRLPCLNDNTRGKSGGGICPEKKGSEAQRV
jgi:hypothetical protein